MLDSVDAPFALASNACKDKCVGCALSNMMYHIFGFVVQGDKASLEAQVASLQVCASL